MKKIKKFLQTDVRDCGVTSLMSIIDYYGGYARREYLREITKTTNDGVSVYSLVECASLLGLEAKAVKGNILNLKTSVPIIAHIVKENNQGHFVVVYEIGKTIKVMDPADGFKSYFIDEWNKISTNVYILYKKVGIVLKQEKEKSFLKTCTPIMKEYKVTFVIIILFSLIYMISGILISYQIKNLINVNSFQIKYILILLILILVLKELSNLFLNYLINYLKHSLDNTLIRKIYNHIIRLPYIYFKNRTKGDIITRINDVFKIRDLISKLFITIFIDFMFIFVILLFIFSINYYVGLIIIIISIIYISVTLFFNKIISKKIKRLKEREVEVNNHLLESIQSIETIKGMVIENMLDSKLEFKYNNLQDISFSLNKNYYQKLLCKNLIFGIGMIIIIYVSLINKLNMGELFILYSLYVTYFEPISNICEFHLEYQDARISFLRIKELLDVPKENLYIKEYSHNNKLIGNIDIHNLVYSYNGIDDVIKCDNLSIKMGSKVLFYGKSGEGKSTLMKLLNRYLNNYKGEILINKKNIKNYNLFDIRTKITYVSSSDIIYSDTLYNNIVLDRKINYIKYLEIVKLCELDSITKRSILKENMMLDNNGYNLSSGEIQRIIIARSLVCDGDIYIFDEITNALDIESERKILKNIFNYLKEKTVIIISHRFNNRDLYGQFVMIKGGIVYSN
ncbi:MAG: ATP-binding cassette domain-containing protein [Bacilli bacterium]|nr:ATP-binding cassette domain-containing protein [Bacilli bacterium]